MHPVGLNFGVMELFVFEAFGRRLRSLAFVPLVLAGVNGGGRIPIVAV